MTAERSVVVGPAIVTAILAYRFVIESISPKDVGYFMLSDQLFFLFLGLISLIFVVNIINRYAYPLTTNQRLIILVLFHITAIVATIILFFT